ncbi:MAG: ChaN family lipoprotein, partial [Moraxellaceae bacterium]|nr:ChaN family lipoprotein [Pseudobdellovibrionaceae bacterium]
MNIKSGFSILISNLFVLLISSCASAQLLNGSTLSPIETQTVVNQVEPGSILIIGEMHGLVPVQAQQMEILNALRAKGLKLALGFEFFNYADQKFIDDFRAKRINEVDFLKAISWGNISFNFYKTQLLFPDAQLNEKALGLNVPSFVT